MNPMMMMMSDGEVRLVTGVLIAAVALLFLAVRLADRGGGAV